MEVHVGRGVDPEIGVGPQRDLAAVLGEQPLPVAPLGDPCGSELGGVGCEERPHVKELGHLRAGHLVHPGAAMGLDIDEALDLQLRERLANGAPAHPQTTGQL